MATNHSFCVVTPAMPMDKTPVARVAPPTKSGKESAVEAKTGEVLKKVAAIEGAHVIKRDAHRETSEVLKKMEMVVKNVEIVEGGAQRGIVVKKLEIVEGGAQRGRLSVPDKKMATIEGGAQTGRLSVPGSSGGSSDASRTPSRSPSPRPADEGTVAKWVEDLVPDMPKGDQSMHEWLKSGQVLCRLLNAIKPNTVSVFNMTDEPFKQMENIYLFMQGARALGVPEYAMFGVPDLYDEKNMDSVTKCLFNLGGAIQRSVPGFRGPKLGVRHAYVQDAKRNRGPVNLAEGYRGSIDISHVNGMHYSNVREIS